CFLCAGACPADCIYIEAAENDPNNPTSAGERYAKVYEIDELRCIFCGFCEEACPTGAITLEPIFEMSDYDRGSMIYDKARLLDPPFPVKDPIVPRDQPGATTPASAP